MTIFFDSEVEINNSGISLERLDGETVIISFETGKYFNANGSAADLLFLIENGIPQSGWAEILSRSFADPILYNEDIKNFLVKILEERIVLPGKILSTKDIDLPKDYSRVDWRTPHLQIFEDLSDLLLIDPIHDTSVEGWPTARDD